MLLQTYKQNPSNFEDFCSSHKQADQKLPMHDVYASQLHKKPVCVVADDTDVLILLFFVTQHNENTVFFR